MIDWAEFDRLTPHIVAALAYNGGEQTLDDVRAGLASGEFQLWPGRDSVIITELTETPRLKILNFFIGGGNLDELRQMVLPIEDWAKSQGISRVVVYGRRGWARTFLNGMGYDPRWVVMVKEL
jgi:hypothetical protein